MSLLSDWLTRSRIFPIDIRGLNCLTSNTLPHTAVASNPTMGIEFIHASKLSNWLYKVGGYTLPMSETVWRGSWALSPPHKPGESLCYRSYPCYPDKQTNHSRFVTCYTYILHVRNRGRYQCSVTRLSDKQCIFHYCKSPIICVSFIFVIIHKEYPQKSRFCWIRYDRHLHSPIVSLDVHSHKS